MEKIEEPNFLEVMQKPADDTTRIIRVTSRKTRLELYAVQNNLRPYLALQRYTFSPLRNVSYYRMEHKDLPHFEEG